MLESLKHAVDTYLGLHVPPQDLGFGQMAIRSVVVFGFAAGLIRLADRRFLGRIAGFDWMLGVVLGSVLSRGVNGQAAFFPTLGACVVLILLHSLLSRAAFHWHWFSVLVKGEPRVLVRDGRVDSTQMARSKITIDDLEENLRINGNESGPAAIAEARLERNGSVSVVRKPPEKNSD